MSSQTTCASREVNTFEEYTLFSLERTTPALLNMMERSKRVATYWPEVGAMVEAAGLCQELAAMASFQMTLDGVFQFGDMTDAVGAEWKAMRERIQFVMDTLEDALTLNEAGPVKRLFSTVLRKDPDGFHLVTPVEKMKITVEDAPFIATRVDREGEALKFLTNVGDEVTAGPENEIRVEMDAQTGEPRPYLHVRRGLEALIARPVFYELVEMAKERQTPDGPRLGVESAGAWFPVGPAGAHRL